MKRAFAVPSLYLNSAFAELRAVTGNATIRAEQLVWWSIEKELPRIGERAQFLTAMSIWVGYRMNN